MAKVSLFVIREVKKDRCYQPVYHRPMTNRLLSFAAFVSLTAALNAGDDFVPLFDGKTLSGWEQHSGKAEYRVENGTIVGKTVPDTGNSFLCTTKKYANFILEIEFKVDPSMNSGIQFRSNYFAKDTEIEVAGKVKRKKSPPIECMAISLRLIPALAPTLAASMTKAAAHGSLI